MKRALVLSLLLTVTIACAARTPLSAPDPTPTDGGLPAVVADKRDAIVRAAKAFDYEALADLLDPATLSYSFGDSGDPIGYWRGLEEDAHVPVLGDILPMVFAMPVGKTGEMYVWPAMSTRDPTEWSDADRASVQPPYTPEDLEAFETAGGYGGWRIGIDHDGTWRYFVQGD